MTQAGGGTTPYISTTEAAASLGVSVSTVKRWVDEGILPAHRTAGGHRKLLRVELLALARRGDLPAEDLAPLVAPLGRGEFESAQTRDALLSALLTGDAAQARDLIRRAYRSGLPIETLADEVISPVMAQVGHEWETARIDVWHEHRGTQICAAALYDLQAELEARAERDRPVALGGAPEGDPYLLPTLLAQLVLLDAGWESVNLGPNTPFDSFAAAIRELKPRLVWLAATHLREEEEFLTGYPPLFRAAERSGAAVAVGGQALTEPLRRRMPYTTHGDRLSHLAAFARTLHPRPTRPRRGRPPKQ